MTAPLVTVLMPVRNAEATIAESLDSVVSQTMEDFEIILVDDGSTDRTREIVGSYDDRRLRLVVNESPRGGVAAHTQAVALATGRFVALHGPSDVMYPERLARQSAVLRDNPGTVMVASSGVIQRGSKLTGTTEDEDDPVVLDWLLYIANVIAPSSVMFRRDVLESIGGYLRPECAPVEDFDFTLRLLEAGAVARIPDVLVRFRLGGGPGQPAEAQAELAARGTALLTRRYAPLIGEAAPAAAAMVVDHLMLGAPLREAEAFDRLARILADLFGAFEARRPLSEEQRRRIRVKTAERWWRAVLTSVRAGHLRAALRGFSALPWHRAAPPSAYVLAKTLGRGLLRPTKR